MNSVSRLQDYKQHIVRKNPPQVAVVAAEAGIDTLNQLNEGLRLAADLLQRMVGEGGTTLNAEQQSDIDTYFDISWRIRKNLLMVRRGRIN